MSAAVNELEGGYDDIEPQDGDRSVRIFGVPDSTQGILIHQ